MGPLSVLMPQRCAVCVRPGPEALCPGCIAALIRLGPTGCARCGAPGPWPVLRCAECAGRRLAFASARGAIAYDARARTLVRAWKERGRRGLAPLLARVVTESVPRPPVDVLAWVPGDRERTRRQGTRAGAAVGGRARSRLGPVGGVPARSHTSRVATGVARARRSAAERSRRVRGPRRRTTAGVSRRRRLHDGLHCERVRIGVATGGRPASRGRLPGQSGALESSRDLVEEARCGCESPSGTAPSATT